MRISRVFETLVQAPVQGTFQESIDGIADFTGLSVSKRSLEDLRVDAACGFDVIRNASSGTRPDAGRRPDFGGGGRW
jgi:hypothetical protein